MKKGSKVLDRKVVEKVVFVLKGSNKYQTVKNIAKECYPEEYNVFSKNSIEKIVESALKSGRVKKKLNKENLFLIPKRVKENPTTWRDTKVLAYKIANKENKNDMERVRGEFAYKGKSIKHRQESFNIMSLVAKKTLSLSSKFIPKLCEEN